MNTEQMNLNSQRKFVPPQYVSNLLFFFFFFTWIEGNPLVVLPAEGFGVELGALVLFEADSAVGARLGNKYINNYTAHTAGGMANSLHVLQH